ncbi:MAG: YIP1 family protein [Gemmatimonadetes bacterium]|nr:YIP1 family protein [Gemmatimonadota bacterium]
MSETSDTFVERVVGATFLSVDTFEEVEADQSATLQAAMVVAIVVVALGIGAAGSGALPAVFSATGAVIQWAVWAGICYLVGAKLFGGEATWGELLHTLGFAQAPGILWLFAIVPILGRPFFAIVPLWVAVASFIAIRQALDIGNGKRVLTILVALGVSGFLETIF